MAFPFSSEGFVMKPFDLLEAIGTGNGHDVLPFFISFQDFRGDPRKLPDKIAVFEYFPHVVNVLYHIEYVKRMEVLHRRAPRPLPVFWPEKKDCLGA
jgi:hypothetical protein